MQTLYQAFGKVVLNADHINGVSYDPYRNRLQGVYILTTRFYFILSTLN